MSTMEPTIHARVTAVVLAGVLTVPITSVALDPPIIARNVTASSLVSIANIALFAFNLLSNAR